MADNDEFVNVFIKDAQNKPFSDNWIKLASSPFSMPELFAADELSKAFPNHSLVMTSDWNLQLLNFPGLSFSRIAANPLFTEMIFTSLPRRLGGPPGVLLDQVQLGAFSVSWEGYDFTVYITQFPRGMGSKTEYFILHDGPEEPARALLLAVGAYANKLHDEIWVFNQGFWNKDAALWTEVQKANWDDVILKPEFKEALKRDVFGFFSSEHVYRELAIPWKRGLIMYGPPGNGKTISLKAVMKSCSARGLSPLYVKSFQSWMGEEGAMAEVFNKARQVAPCVIILEDLDSLINDRNRSFFLNQMDGLEGNDGLLVIGTTNHFDRLDPGLSTRPSRFDRKYLFDDPDRDERLLYAKYWQNKLENNKKISFPNRLVDEIVATTDRFSFAYLKEAFVSTLVTLAGYETEDHPTFEQLLKDQIKTLRKQLDKPSFRPYGRALPSPSATASHNTSFYHSHHQSAIARGPEIHTSLSTSAARPGTEQPDARVLFDRLADSVRSVSVGGHDIPAGGGERNYRTGMNPTGAAEGRDLRVLLDELSVSATRSNVNSVMPSLFSIPGQRIPAPNPVGDVTNLTQTNDAPNRQYTTRSLSSRWHADSDYSPLMRAAQSSDPFN